MRVLPALPVFSNTSRDYTPCNAFDSEFGLCMFCILIFFKMVLWVCNFKDFFESSSGKKLFSFTGRAKATGRCSFFRWSFVVRLSLARSPVKSSALFLECLIILST